MKLLDWMHRKFKQNSTGEPFKDLGIGHSCNCLSGQPSLDEQQYYQKYYYDPLPSKHQKDYFQGKSYTGRNEVEDYLEEDYSDDTDSEYFNGLLTIGTFGSETGLLAPDTPTFPTVEDVTEKETNITENDLKVINEELEKVLGADVKEEKWTDSSGRTSHVSTITLSGTEGVGNRSTVSVCPLQGYLFGSPVELSEATTAAKKEKENRTSLGELFQRTKIEEVTGERGEKEEKRGEREGEKSAKKTLKRRLLGSSTADSVSADKKLNKILQMFHKKVHPEGVTPTKKCYKAHKNDMKNINPHDGRGYSNENHNLPDETSTCQRISVSKECIRHSENHSNPPTFAIGRNDSIGNREYWIKTDADYLVLEL